MQIAKFETLKYHIYVNVKYLKYLDKDMEFYLNPESRYREVLICVKDDIIRGMILAMRRND